MLSPSCVHEIHPSQVSPSLTFIPFIFSGQPMKPAEKEDEENLFLKKHTRNSY